MARNTISRLSLGGSARKSRRHSRRRSARLRPAKTTRRSDTWLVLSGALAAALAPISGPFVATESFWSRLPAAVRPCGSAAELPRSLLDRVGRRHGFGTGVEHDAGQQAWFEGFVAFPPLHPVLFEMALHASPQIFIDD